MPDRFVIQQVTWATVYVLELNDIGAYEHAFVVQGGDALKRARRFADMLNSAAYVPPPTGEPL